MMNGKPTSLQHGLKLLAVWCAALTSPCQAQTITWLHPTAAGRYKVESAIPDPRIAVRVTTGDGKVVDSAEALANAGWQWTEDRFWQNPRGASRQTEGRRLNVSVSRLPAARAPGASHANGSQRAVKKRIGPNLRVRFDRTTTEVNAPDRG